MKVIDPVCKMTIDSEKAAATSEYKGQTIYFCAKGCKARFDAASDKYVSKLDFISQGGFRLLVTLAGAQGTTAEGK